MTESCRDCHGYEAVGDAVRLEAMSVGGMPTRWWHCGDCDRHLERWWGGGDVACQCGALYNSSGQRLRDDAPMYGGDSGADWDADDGPGDMEAYELRCLRDEGGR